MIEFIKNKLFQFAWFIIKKKMINDPDYAWDWCCNIARVAMYTGATRKHAFFYAARFVRDGLGVNVTNDPRYNEAISVTMGLVMTAEAGSSVQAGEVVYVEDDGKVHPFKTK